MCVCVCVCSSGRLGVWVLDIMDAVVSKLATCCLLLSLVPVCFSTQYVPLFLLTLSFKFNSNSNQVPIARASRCWMPLRGTCARSTHSRASTNVSFAFFYVFFCSRFVLRRRAGFAAGRRVKFPACCLGCCSSIHTLVALLPTGLKQPAVYTA